MARHQRHRLVPRWLAQSETAPGVVLIACAAAALALANSPWAAAWHALFHHALPWTPIARLASLHDWINDAAMVVFFFVVGLEIKRETIAGALADPRQRTLPVIAALAGMILPALVFLAIAGGSAALRRGWAIPAATDIAFAVGVLALVGRGLPPSLRLFLLTVAIVDDLGAVLIIAGFYTSDIDILWLSISVVLFGALLGLNRLGVRSIPVYLFGALLLWFAVLHSGVHATIAGVAAALTVPLALDRHGNSPLLRLEHALVLPNALLVVPLFALANAGVAMDTMGPAALFAPLPLAIGAGLVLGKQAGILLSVLACERLGVAARPTGATTPQLWGLALLCGIGFTMSLFVAGLAYPASPELVDEAKLGILAGSILSAALGALVLRTAPKPMPTDR
ncbi:MAG: hypothetical protein RIS94_1818 [Pseudomonadota bacterium]|jgi:NhaA family Na+:H+ antiporter